MRVVHVAPTPFGAEGLFGGGERYALELARALARHVECRLVTFARSPFERLEPGGLRVTALPSLGRLRTHPAHPIAPALPRALRSADVVHAHHLRALPSRVASLAAATRRQVLAVTDHGMTGGDWGGLFHRLVDRFLLVSAYSARELRAPPDRSRVVHGGADPERYRPDPDVVREGVLFVGRITPHKGLDRLIPAVPPAVPLLVAGTEGHDPRAPESGYPSLLRRLARGRDVRFLGPVPDAALPALVRSAGVLALPSVARTCYGRNVAVSELLGLVAIEAMASGTPVVASRIGGLPEVVADGETGFLVEPGDVDGLRERLGRVLGDRRLAARLGARGREVAVHRFTWDACAARCLAAYEEALGERPRHRAAPR